MGRATVKKNSTPPPGALGRGQKVKYHLISISKIFLPNFVFVLPKWKIQNISDRILIMLPWSCPRGQTKGCQGGQKKFKHGHVAYQIDGDDEQNRMQVKFLS